MRLPTLGQVGPGLVAAMALGALGFGWLLSPSELGARLRRARDMRAGVPATPTQFGHGLGYAGILREYDQVSDPLEVITLRARVSLPAGVGEPRLMARRLPPYLYAPREFTAALDNRSVAQLRALAVMAPVRRPPPHAGVSITAAQALVVDRGA